MKRTILIPTKKKSSLIGHGGQVVKSIEEKSGGRIHISKDETMPTLRVNLTASDDPTLDLMTDLIEIKLGIGSVQRLPSHEASIIKSVSVDEGKIKISSCQS